MGYLRYADSQDIDLLFRWANERTVRKNAFSPAEITYEEHCRWFAQILAREDARQYIFMCEEEPVGQIRVTVEGSKAVIGYSICPEKRCQGYGKEMVHLLIEQVKKDFPSVETLAAKVKPDNIASQKVFLDMGYAYKYNAYELDLNLESQPIILQQST